MKALTWFLCAIGVLAALAQRGAAAEPDSFTAIRASFANPPAEFSTAPFFVWNGEVTESDIDRVLAEYGAEGIQAFFIHPRPGLITPYLSERWFSLIRYTVDKARASGMRVWLYDENSYPSGFAGGHVPAEMPESYNQGQGLLLRKLSAVDAATAGKCAVLLKRSGERFTDVTKAAAGERGKSGEYYCFELAFYNKRGWHGGFSYVDLIRPGVTEKFIELTMRGYERSVGNEFGKLVPGIFTDEPNIATPVRNSMRWTPDLFEQFQKRWGYDLKTNLVSLFQETGDWRKVRHNYYSVLLQLFIDRWAKPWYRYAESKGIAWTGHYWEHGWPSPEEGPDNMAMYAWHQVPGIDMLFNQYSETVSAQFGNVRSVKELASVANQLGRRRTLSETYGGSGWELRFEDMKRLGDWEYALGVNLMNQHLSYQTMLGARKYDWPQSFSYHTPWWGQYRPLAQYFARLSLALSGGEQVNRVLVLEPTSSAWMYAPAGAADPRMRQVGNAFQEFITRLEALQGEYDLGCENIIKGRGKAERGKFVVGRRAYNLVVLPPGTENLDSSTVKLLAAYAAGGGKVLSFVDAPAYVGGAPSNAVIEIAARHPRGWTRAQSLDDADVRARLLPDDFQGFEGKIFHHRRKLSDGEVLFFVNTSLEQNARGSLRLNAKSLTRLDTLDGTLAPYPARMESGSVAATFELPPAGSLLLFAGSRGSLAQAVPETLRALPPVAPTGPIAVKRLTPNVLAIDYCDLKLAGKVLPHLYFYKAADTVFRHFGFAEGDPWNTAVQYKTGILDRDRFPPGSGFSADFHFKLEGPVDRSRLRAVVERPEVFKVRINGKPVAPIPGEWWLDRGLGIYEIGTHVVGGTNTITVAVEPMSVHAELEPVYILGEFGVEPQERGWKITSATPLALGPWKDQKLPFYSDWISYSAGYRMKGTPARYKVQLGKWAGTVAEVRVNGKPAGIIYRQPYELEITRTLRPGDNQIEVRVCGSLKNLLGPHHGKISRGLSSPWSFRSAPEQTPAGASYDLDAYGLLGSFQVIEVALE